MPTPSTASPVTAASSVEVYRVKSFAEALNHHGQGRASAASSRSAARAWARRCATPSRSSSAVSSRVKHLFLLSDGFPQDYDYGQDRRSNVYGIRDTAAALREAEAAGVTPFCITVDKAGHDYLRQMCDESRYMVIDDITAAAARAAEDLPARGPRLSAIDGAEMMERGPPCPPPRGARRCAFANEPRRQLLCRAGRRAACAASRPRHGGPRSVRKRLGGSCGRRITARCPPRGAARTRASTSSTSMACMHALKRHGEKRWL